MKAKALSLILPLLAVMSASEAQTLRPLAGWRYIAYDADFWQPFTKDIEARAFKSAFESAHSRQDSADPAKNESRLAMAKALRGLEYFQLAFDLLAEILETSPGSYAANEALVELSTLLPSGTFDEERLKKAINRKSFAEVPHAALPLLGYFLVIGHLEQKQTRWMKGYKKFIEPESYWMARLQYFKALNLTKENKIQDAIAALIEVENHKGANAQLKFDARLQQARLHFELADYPAAEKIYADLQSGDRNTGRILYERAWNQYYLKDYALALGMLESLKAPYFSPAIDPEQYILGSVILRDLCHYQEVKQISKTFFTSFNETLNHIRKSRPLEQSPILMSMTLVRQPFRHLADVVDLMQKESERFTREFKGSKYKKLAEQYAKHIGEIKGRLSRRLDQPLRSEARRLLIAADQIKLLDYVSELDKNRIQSVFESRGYKPETADTLRFEKLYWPMRTPATEDSSRKTKKEFWFHEMPNLRVLVSDRCKAVE
ncbi:MAG: hypothetical protein AB7G93_20885 [Bdellovibrionales bacterium]